MKLSYARPDRTRPAPTARESRPPLRARSGASPASARAASLREQIREVGGVAIEREPRALLAREVERLGRTGERADAAGIGGEAPPRLDPLDALDQRAPAEREAEQQELGDPHPVDPATPLVREEEALIARDREDAIAKGRVEREAPERIGEHPEAVVRLRIDDGEVLAVPVRDRRPGRVGAHAAGARDQGEELVDRRAGRPAVDPPFERDERAWVVSHLDRITLVGIRSDPAALVLEVGGAPRRRVAARGLERVAPAVARGLRRARQMVGEA
ncbi:MAG: hypothetical protein ACRENJ_07580 [Candidatus Eiseniibacteriota bacterium]